jgi:hypothetical protein
MVDQKAEVHEVLPFVECRAVQGVRSARQAKRMGEVRKAQHRHEGLQLNEAWELPPARSREDAPGHDLPGQQRPPEQLREEAEPCRREVGEFVHLAV